jgi:molybdopterin-guanine dinucleotide biosynthesis protein
MRVIGLSGWSGADVDQPGKDSFRHRAAGAREVLVVEKFTRTERRRAAI